MPNTSPKISFHKMRAFFFFGLMGILIISFLYLIRPFFYPVFWAAIIAVMFHPLYEYVNNKLKAASVSAFVSLLLIFVIIFLPLVLVGTLLIQQSVELYTSFSKENLVPNVQGIATWLQGTSLAPYIEEIRGQWAGYATNAAQTVSVFLFQHLRSVTQNSVRVIFMLFIMLYTLYYAFKDGARFLNYLMHLSPLGNGYERMLYDKFRSTAAATLKSTFIIGGIQGSLGGLLFWITGVPGAFIWAVIMMALSMIPGIGAFIVWAPAGVIMILLGNVWQGVTILVVGAVLISTIDNLLRPPLIGKDTEMHPLIVLLSTLGGIIMFGISGFVIGPIIAALFLSIITIYDYYYRNELQNN